MISFLVALPRRQLYLGTVALLLAVILIARWIGNWGLVTIHVKDQPLAKVIASIARQGGVRIESSLDPSSPVTMDVVKVTAIEALDKLTMVTESEWRVVYLAAPTKTAINEALLSLNGSGKIENWITNYYPGQGGFWGADYGPVNDPRFLPITLEGPDPDLGKLLDEAAQKSGVMTALPKDWLPSTKLPKPTSVQNAISSMVGSVHGKTAEFFLLTERPRRSWDGARPAEGEGGGDSASGSRPSGSANQQPYPEGLHANPDWVEQRQLAQIKKLPADKQPQALKDRAERKALFDSLKGLTPEERRAKIQDMMANSEMGQKIQDAQLLRQAQQTAEKRITRAVNYLNRKAAAKAAQ